MSIRQASFDFFNELPNEHSREVNDAISILANSQNLDTRGAVFTRPEVVNFILDLIGYTIDQPIFQKRILEPSFGGGDFLLIIIRRLLAAWREHNSTDSALDSLSNSIRAVELHRGTFQTTYNSVVILLMHEGFSDKTANTLAGCWLHQGDFLLTPLDGHFDFVVGNPPYVRQELIPASLLAEYRSRYQTIYDRADLYIPFIERSLSILVNHGQLGFICSDRWMKNRYGGPLRSFISENFHLKFHVDMFGTQAFQSNVIAYPAITVISRESPQATRIAHRPSVNTATLKRLADELLKQIDSKEITQVHEIDKVANGSEPWLLESQSQMTLIRNLEQKFPSLEEAGCKVGIGVATGADKEFIGNFNNLDVESDRKLPLVTTRDIVSGEVKWLGQGVINPFTDNGDLVHLPDYPKLRSYLEDRRTTIASRHCVKKSPKNWYRTIDRITPSLASKPKLLIPDIKGKAHIVFEDGKLYPHHNLYYITSTKWDLRALQAVLLSAVTHLFISTYTTKMHGGFFRFQAQYLRRIRIPHWESVPVTIQVELQEAAIKYDIEACNLAVFKLYGLNQEEISILGVNGE